MTQLLEIHRVSKSFGGSRVLNDVSFTVACGEIVALVGPNGSGKTTVLNLISRLMKPDVGEVLLDGHHLLRKRPHEVARLGVGRVFQVSSISPDLSVSEEIALGSYWQYSISAFLGLQRSNGNSNPRFVHNIEVTRADILRVLELFDVADRQTGSLPYAQRRYTEVARATQTATRLLILDEPTAGLATSERVPVSRALQLLKGAGIGILLVDHDMAFVSEIADRCVLLAEGRVRADGSTRQILASNEMQQLYLGG